MKLRRGIVFGLAAAMALSYSMRRQRKRRRNTKEKSARKSEGANTGRQYIREKQLLDCIDHRYGQISGQSFNSPRMGRSDRLKNSRAWRSAHQVKRASRFRYRSGKAGRRRHNLLWGMGYACADSFRGGRGQQRISSMQSSAMPDDTPDNVTGVMFRARGKSLMVGYVAGRPMAETTNRWKLVGGISSES